MMPEYLEAASQDSTTCQVKYNPYAINTAAHKEYEESPEAEKEYLPCTKVGSNRATSPKGRQTAWLLTSQAVFPRPTQKARSRALTCAAISNTIIAGRRRRRKRRRNKSPRFSRDLTQIPFHQRH